MSFPLREYYASYLKNIRNLSASSVNHYLDAINWISRYLVEKGLLKASIYEITSLSDLEQIKDVLLSDEAFIAMNKRGHQMYSAGLNNYIRFAEGDCFEKIGVDLRRLDIPMKLPHQSDGIVQKTWNRSEIIKCQSIRLANYECEINRKHATFISARNGMPYMEGHHTIPMRLQDSFDISLDVYANIVCVCPTCHRFLQFGRKEDKLIIAEKIYYNRADRLAHSGIVLGRKEFLDIVC